MRSSVRVGPIRKTGDVVGPSGSGKGGPGTPMVPAEITVHPEDAQAEPGQTATFTVTATGTPAPSYQWQVDAGGGYGAVVGGTGATTNSYETPELAAEDDGNLYRCVASNAAGSDISNPATLGMILNQDAILFDGDAEYAQLTLGAAFGDPGMLDHTLAGWFYFEAPVELQAGILIAIGQAGREAGIQTDNEVPPAANVSVGDSNTGVTTDAWGADSPPFDEWIFMTFRGPAAHPGVFTATWQAEDGGTIHSITRANGMEDSIAIATISLGYPGSGTRFRAQYVRGYNSRLDDGVLDAERTLTDPTGSFFFNVFEDDGLGGVEVRDASGNNRVFTLTGGELAVGPIVGPVP